MTMLTRIISGIIGLILLLFFVIKGGLLLNTAILIITLIALFEYNNAFKKLNLKPLSLLSYLFAISLFILVTTGYFSDLNLLVFLYVLSCMLLLVIKKQTTIQDVAVTILGGVYIVFFLFHIGLLDGSKFIWLVFITAWATDTFAYFTGMILGKRKLCPDLSPKKTVEGAIGGIIGTVIVTFIFIKMFNIGYTFQVMILSILCSIMAQIGDLAASKLKRTADIKDYGYIMPGHGGILDRFDSILFTAPIVYYYVTYVIEITL